jgi:hypothetical protein
MNREIKFRAWCKKNEIMHREWKDLDAKNEILMQYTGLKDKKGKEIYEGDIVKEREWKQEIRWSIENSGFWVGTSYHLNMRTAQEIEIIGNIYENKELLTNQKE